MSQKNLCRLCVNICQDHKILYDDKGHGNEVYELMTIYFNESVLNKEEGNHLMVICLECWLRISDFHNFQLTVHQAQKNNFKKYQYYLNSDEEFLPEDSCACPIDRNLCMNDQIIYIKSEDVGLSGSASSNNLSCDVSTRKQEEVAKHEVKSEEYLPVQVTGIEGSTRKDEDNTTISVPKLELMDVFSGDDISQEFLLDEYNEPAAIIIENEFSEGGSFYSETNGKNTSTFFKPNANSEGLIFNDTLTRNKHVKDSDNLIAEWKPRLECELCSENCATYSLLRKHFLDKHPLEKCYIICCQRKFYRRNIIESHIRHHIDSNAFACKLCDKHYKTKNILAVHMRKHHIKSIAGSRLNSTQKNIANKELDDLTAQWKSTLECAICRQTCSSLNVLQVHFRQKHTQNQFYIECCQRKLKSRHDIEEHILLHINPNAFKCELCDTRHTTELFLLSHMKSHHSKSNEGITKTSKRKMITNQEYNDLITQWKPNLECVVCRKTCSSLPLLQLHFGQNHPQSELYIECCNRKLKRRDHILEHIRLHTDPNAFKCELCSKCFSCRKHLLRHTTTQHPVGMRQIVEQGNV